MIYDKILVLENDIEFQGLPSILKHILIDATIPHKVWWNFDNTSDDDTYLHLLNDKTLLLAYPSFAGPGNTLENKLFFFLKLKEAGIKINLCVIYYTDFYWYILQWLNDYNFNKAKKKNKLQLLKEILDFHNITYIKYMDATLKNNVIEEHSIKITYDSIIENYFETDSNVKIKETGEVYPVYSTSIYENEPERSYVTLRIPDARPSREEVRKMGQDYIAIKTDFKFNEIEKCN